LLDLAPTDSQELAAPHGLVRSRAVTDLSQHVRLALNVPVLAGPGDPAPQHLALACDDALGLARAVRDRGVQPLHIPDNYYADLAARLDLDDELLGALRELHVLYDRDDRGELLHFYLPWSGAGSSRCSSAATATAGSAPITLPCA
jgi:4-hydroxyphenylpyruvate dioxygenase